jgi:hypothetical protein
MNFPQFSWAIFLLGCAGGLVPDILRVVANRYDPKLPDYFKSLKFWIGTLCLVLLGGIVAYLTEPKRVMDAFIYGYAAPEFLARLAGSVGSSPLSVETKVLSSLRVDELVRGVVEEEPKLFNLSTWWRT